MPFNSVRPKFYQGASVFNRYEETLDEPPSGETNGTTLNLSYTQRAGELLYAVAMGGPLDRARVDVSTDGGTVWLPADGLDIDGAFKLRGVAVPFSGDDTEASSFALVTIGEGSDANWSG